MLHDRGEVGRKEAGYKGTGSAGQEERRWAVRGRERGHRKGGTGRRKPRGKKGGRKREAWWVQGPRHGSIPGMETLERCVHCLNLI